MKMLLWATILLLIFSCKEEPISETDIDEFVFQPVSTGEIVKHSYISLAYSEVHEQAKWVYYVLTPDFVNGKILRSNNYRKDPSVKSESASVSDYTNSGYTKGHLCPAGSMKFDSTSMSETFYMSNISPQDTNFNKTSSAWYKIEELIRGYVLKYSKVYVVTGPVLRDSLGVIGKNSKVAIPSAFYNVVFNGKDQMVGFLVPVKAYRDLPITFIVPVDSIESITGINFFPELPDSLENRIESKYEMDYWK
jgi:endonuclease G